MITRSGFTLMELVLVACLMGLLFLISVPKLSHITLKSTVRAARGEVASTLAIARATALQRGYPVVFHATGGTIWLTAEVAGASVALGSYIPLSANYGVSLVGTVDTIRFDPRGVTRPVLTGIQKLVVERAGTRDSVCVTALGLVLGRSCSL